MTLNFTSKILVVMVIVTLSLTFLLAHKTLAADFDPLGPACSGSAANSPACVDRARGGDNPLLGPDGIIVKVTRFVAALVGVASVIMIILGGYTYTTSSGDPQKTKAAKDTMLYAIIGLVIAATAGLLVGFIIGKL